MQKSLVLACALSTLFVARAHADSTTLPNDKKFVNPTGASSSHSTLGDTDLTQGFFQKLGTNDRTCGTCHLASDGWSVSVSSAQKIFNDSEGLAALFQFDGQNAPGLDRSTLEARRIASSLMITKALVRFNLALPSNAEFQIVASEGTYGNPITPTSLVVYRRILPTTNFRDLQTVLWDGRGNTIPGTTNAAERLAAIFIGGTALHAEGTVAPSDAEAQIAKDFMLSLSNAQIIDQMTGALDVAGAFGGALNHSNNMPTPAAGVTFNLFNAWASPTSSMTGSNPNRAQVARGQALFNNRVFPNGGKCSGCHTSPNQGNNSNNVLFNIGIADATRRTPDLPLYTLKNLATKETVQSSDPGLGMTTGKWADVGKFKAPQLRGLASRAPYFHNGFASSLEAVVNFYNGRFNIGLTEAEKADLVAFLRSL